MYMCPPLKTGYVRDNEYDTLLFRAKRPYEGTPLRLPLNICDH